MERASRLRLLSNKKNKNDRSEFRAFGTLIFFSTCLVDEVLLMFIRTFNLKSFHEGEVNEKSHSAFDTEWLCLFIVLRKSVLFDSDV